MLRLGLAVGTRVVRPEENAELDGLATHRLFRAPELEADHPGARVLAEFLELTFLLLRPRLAMLAGAVVDIALLLAAFTGGSRRRRSGRRPWPSRP